MPRPLKRKERNEMMEAVFQRCKRVLQVKPGGKVACGSLYKMLKGDFPELSKRGMGVAVKKCFPNVRRNHPGNTKKGQDGECYYGVTFTCPEEKNMTTNQHMKKVTTQKAKVKGLLLKQNLKAKHAGHEKVNVPPHLKLKRELITLDEGCVGKGVFGNCLSGTYRDIPVAIKIFKNPEQLKHDVLKAKVMKEAAIMLQLQPNKNLPTLFGIEVSSTPFWMVTLYHHVAGKGMTVFKALRAPPAVPLPVIDWMDLTRQVGSGLQAIHRSGVVHNDLKDDNVVLHLKGQVYTPVIVDFGKACRQEERKMKNLTLEEQLQWKAMYKWIAPELIEGKEPYSLSTDIYSFGYMVKGISKKIKTSDSSLQEVAKICMADSPNRASLTMAILSLG